MRRSRRNDTTNRRLHNRFSVWLASSKTERIKQVIFTAILTVLLAIVMGVFGILPDVPPIPTAIADASQDVIDFVGQGTSLLAVIFTPALLSAAVVVILAMFFFSKVYHVTMWVLKKIPLLGIK